MSVGSSAMRRRALSIDGVRRGNQHRHYSKGAGLLSLSLFLVDRLPTGGFLLCCFPLKFVGILLQSILVGRLGKAGR